MHAVVRKRTNIRYHLYVASKIWHKWTYLQNRNKLTDRELRFVVAKDGVGKERDELEVWGW